MLWVQMESDLASSWLAHGCSAGSDESDQSDLDVIMVGPWMLWV